MLAVCGGKGGVGKTTVAVGVARALAEQHRRVLLVEADADMPDLHVVANTPAEPGVDAIARGEPLADSSHAAGPQGLSVVPATPGADVAGALDRLSADGEILLDCPAGGRRAAAVPLRVADRAVVVTTRAPAAVRDAAKTAAMARELGADVLGTVVTRADGVSGVGEAVGTPVIGRIPEASDPLADAGAVAAYGRLASELQEP